MSVKNTESVAALTDKMNQLRDELLAVESRLMEATNLRREDPVGDLARIIYLNTVSSSAGGFGYTYGDSPSDTDRARAQKAIAAAGGDMDIAERFIVEFSL